MSTIKVYLAPANHYNAYCISGYDEKTQCEKLAGLVQRELEATELAARINDFVLALPQAERRVFLCRYWYLDSVAEIAIRFGFSTSKVKSMLYRIRQQLRQTLEQEGLL